MPKIPVYNIRNQSKLFQHGKAYKKTTIPIRESEKDYFRRLKKNYNRYIDRQVKAWQKVDPRATYESLVRQGLVTPKLQKGLGDYTSRKQFISSLKAMDEAMSTGFKKQQLDDMHVRMKEVIKKAYAPTPEIQDVIDQIVDSMSPQDMVRHGLDNPDIVSDYYDKYKEHVDHGMVDAEMYDQNLMELLVSLEPYADNAQLEELQAHEYLLQMRIASKMKA